MATAGVQKNASTANQLEYKGNCTAAKAMQVMIDNNLSFEIALYPYELVTYGETGSVCANWMQYNLIMKYLEIMRPSNLGRGIWPPYSHSKSKPEAPRVSSPTASWWEYDNMKDWEMKKKWVAQLWSNDSRRWMYIGLSIVHGTFTHPSMRDA